MGKEMNEVKIGSVRAFPGVTPDKAQALKVVEEAAEVFSAWEQWSSIEDDDIRDMLVGELADCITACANLAAALGVHDLRPYIGACERKNAERGRYGR